MIPLIGIIAFVVLMLVSVMIHEWGHFASARRFGMKATDFFVGFGPTLWSTRRGETEYGIKAIPAGGFVKIVGMTELEEVAPEDEARAFYKQPAHRRAVVLVAGSFMHFVIAAVILVLTPMLFGASAEQTTTVADGLGLRARQVRRLVHLPDGPVARGRGRAAARRRDRGGRRHPGGGLGRGAGRHPGRRPWPGRPDLPARRRRGHRHGRPGRRAAPVAGRPRRS